MLICILYKQPNCSKYLDPNFDRKFDEMLDTALRDNKETIVLGDINRDYLQQNKQPGVFHFHFIFILKFFTEGDPSARGWFSRDPLSKIQYHVITNLITKKILNLNTNTKVN